MSLFSAELFRRAIYLELGPLEITGERRSAEWPRALMWQRERGSIELWVGRAYLCVARRSTRRVRVETEPLEAGALQRRPSADVVAFRPRLTPTHSPAAETGYDTAGNDVAVARCRTVSG
jgi:hypothetical protein